ncbi:uncharacterized protein LOC142169586 [Nicotiana tabacum]|uniref:Uncharacterized protein LOC142169586 n=1 Tax=Nicotiana tabacum TaxID=4097 RepID=A0AC58SRH3_TOBAC
MVIQGNPGSCAIGFVLRNKEGDIIYACGKYIPEGTNTKAEAKAMVKALRYCVECNFVLIDLHTDSMILKKAVEGEWSVLWSVAREVEEIKELIARCKITLSHTLREGNKLADHLANRALEVGPSYCNCLVIWIFKEGGL